MRRTPSSTTSLGLISALSLGVLTACGGGGGGGSNPSPGGGSTTPPASSTFNIRVDAPSSTIAQNRQHPVEKLLGLFVEDAYAVDRNDLTQNDFQIAIVDPNGIITELVNPISFEVFPGGLYRVVLPGGERRDCVIIADVSGQPNLSVGDRLDAERFLYTPTVDVDEELTVDLSSTLGFDIFLDNIDTFDNISVEELDAIIEGAQDLLGDTDDLTGTTLTELINQTRSQIESFVSTQTQLGNLTNDQPGQTTTPEQDQANLRAFISDLNTLRVLGEQLVTDNGDGALEQLVQRGELAGEMLGNATSSLEALQQIADVLVAFHSTASAAGTPVTRNIADLFAPSSTNLTGQVSYANTQISATLGGSHNGVSVDISLNLQAPANSQTVNLTLSGTLDSSEARLVLGQDTRINITSDVTANNLAGNTTAQDSFINGINAADLALNLTLTAKNVANNTDAVFQGTISAEGVRSTANFQEFANGPTESFYNISQATFDGSFSFGTDRFTARVEAEQDNARTFVPDTQTLESGTNDPNLLTYTFNDTMFRATYPGGFTALEFAELDGANYSVSVERTEEIGFKSRTGLASSTAETLEEAFASSLAVDVDFTHNNLTYDGEITPLTVGNNIAINVRAFDPQQSQEINDSSLATYNFDGNTLTVMTPSHTDTITSNFSSPTRVYVFDRRQSFISSGFVSNTQRETNNTQMSFEDALLNVGNSVSFSHQNIFYSGRINSLETGTDLPIQVSGNDNNGNQVIDQTLAKYSFDGSVLNITTPESTIRYTLSNDFDATRFSFNRTRTLSQPRQTTRTSTTSTFSVDSAFSRTSCRQINFTNQQGVFQSAFTGTLQQGINIPIGVSVFDESTQLFVNDFSIASYDYDGSVLTLRAPQITQTCTIDSVSPKRFSTVTRSSQFSTDSPRIISDDEAAFEQAVDNAYRGRPIFFRIPRVGEFIAEIANPTKGTDQPVTAVLLTPASLKDRETNTNFRRANVKLTTTMNLTGFGETSLTADVRRTGFDDGVVTLRINSISSANLNTAVTLVASVVDGKIATALATGNNNLAVNLSLLEENEEVTLTLGTATATLKRIDIGVRVTYQDGTFEVL